MRSFTDTRQERVARALCYAAATEYQPACPMCAENHGVCSMWRSFMREAALAIKAYKGK